MKIKCKYCYEILADISATYAIKNIDVWVVCERCFHMDFRNTLAVSKLRKDFIKDTKTYRDLR